MGVKHPEQSITNILTLYQCKKVNYCYVAMVFITILKVKGTQVRKVNIREGIHV